MDKETLYTYGLTIVSIIIVFSLLVIVTPTALDITKQTDKVTNDLLTSANDFSDNNSSTDYATLTLNFTFEDNPDVNPLENYPNKVKVKYNDRYDISVPVVQGYTSNIENVNGIMTGDLEIPIIYTPVE